jgi:hypothetical protein
MTLCVDLADRNSCGGAQPAFGGLRPRGRCIGPHWGAKGIHAGGDLPMAVQPHAHIDSACFRKLTGPGLFRQFHDAAGPLARTGAQRQQQQRV